MEIHNYSFKKLIRGVTYAAICVAGMAISNVASAQMSGNYTIDKGSAASATNFKSFDAAVDALRGITRSDGGPSLGGGVNGAVTINVVANSGPYTEKITIPSISGASASNTITFNGNGETIQASGTSGARHVIWLNGADRITLQDLHIKSTNSTYGWGVRLSSNADYNVIEDCDVDITSVTASSYSANLYNSGGIIMSNSSAYTYGGSTRGYNGKYNVFQNNYIHGRTSGYGMAVGICVSGPSTTGYLQYNEVLNNEVHAFRYYGIYHYYSSGEIFDGNEIHRTGMSQFSAYYFYGIYNS